MARGFDEFFGFLGADHSYLDTEASTNNPLLDGREVAGETTYLTDAITDRSVDFLKRQKSEPFSSTWHSTPYTLRWKRQTSTWRDSQTSPTDDISETKNLVATHPEKVKELGDEWQRWNKELMKPLWTTGAG